MRGYHLIQRRAGVVIVKANLDNFRATVFDDRKYCWDILDDDYCEELWPLLYTKGKKREAM